MAPLPDIDALTDKVVALAREAGAVILEIYRSDFEVRAKADTSPVTEADERAEALILARLAEIAPGVPAVGEEMYAAGARPDISGGVFWLVDALDGTREFTERGDEFTVNIALVRAGVPVLGVVHAPALDVTYWGGPGGAFRQANGETPEPIAARAPDSDGLVALVSKSHRSNEGELLKQHTIKTEVSRGSSLKFCMLAAGEADIYPRLGPTSEWDTAAGHAVLLAAGGAMTQIDGRPVVYGKADIRNPHFVARGRTG